MLTSGIGICPLESGTEEDATSTWRIALHYNAVLTVCLGLTTDLFKALCIYTAHLVAIP